jgi:hypothetical protein
MKMTLIKLAFALSLGAAPVAALAQAGSESEGATVKQPSAGAAQGQVKGQGAMKADPGARAAQSAADPGKEPRPSKADADTAAKAKAAASETKPGDAATQAEDAQPKAKTQAQREPAKGEAEQKAGAASEPDAATQAQGEKPKRETESQAQDTKPADPNAPAQAETTQPKGDADQKTGAAEGEAAGQDKTTTAAIPEVTVEQKTEIRTVIKEVQVEPVREVDFDINIGIAVPRTIELHVLPPRIVEIVPAYEGYRYFILADGRIIIVEPDTYEIVYVIA